eukprot:TRINITY_DN19909_c0_g1_i1.p1 TRINITY_DN19909_c0_g1~~TRINITY_DN19909_c0_g1_i1.p1  ORF type:complete len:226 (-),score=15.68 TRINITY_DN19909_c0_g1_i1:685-1362(-)
MRMRDTEMMTRCQHKPCLLKDEGYTFLLPIFRELFQLRHNLCVVHAVRDPLYWSVSNNTLGLRRWYEPLFGIDPHSYPQGDGSLSPQWMEMKAKLWSRVYLGLANWIRRSRTHGKRVTNIVWRCQQDSLDQLVEQLKQARCLEPHIELPAFRPNKLHANSLNSIERLQYSTSVGERKSDANLFRFNFSDPQVINAMASIVRQTEDVAKEWGVFPESMQLWKAIHH